MDFEWDEAKASLNLRKHGIDFDEAARIFAGPVRTVSDARRDYGEPRFIALGQVQGRTLRVTYTIRGGRYRIISAWKAGRHDQEAYRSYVAG